MKNLIKNILLSFLLILGISNEINAQDGQNYMDLGLYTYSFSDGTSIGIHGYVVKSLNNSGHYPEYKYCYILVCDSKSVYNRRYTSTWLYTVRVFLNGSEVSAKQYPYGFSIYVKTTPTPIYYWYTNDEFLRDYYLTWGSSAYDTK